MIYGLKMQPAWGGLAQKEPGWWVRRGCGPLRGWFLQPWGLQHVARAAGVGCGKPAGLERLYFCQGFLVAERALAVEPVRPAATSVPPPSL